jgi:hypothetical protein
MHCAAHHGNLNVVRLLAERRGSNVKLKNKQGRTPLHSAAAAGHVKLVQYLLKEGADINATGRFGETPLHCAASAGYTDIVRILVEEGAEIMYRKKDGQTPLHSAAASGHCAVVNLLLEAGADICATDKDGLTALGEATSLGRKNMAKMLLEKEGDYSGGSGCSENHRGTMIKRSRPSRDKGSSGLIHTVSLDGLQRGIKLRGKGYRNTWTRAVKEWEKPPSPWQTPFFSCGEYIRNKNASILANSIGWMVGVVMRRVEAAMCCNHPGDGDSDHGGYRQMPAPPII